MEQISFERRGNVGLVTLNRPDRLNAWTNQMNGELCDIIAQCNADADIGAVVVTGAGRGFCAGADIKDNFQARLEGKTSSQPTRTLPDWVTLVRGSKPLLAAVNGAAIGVGATMILPFDVIIASDRARFGMGFIKMGLVPELGLGRASEMCLTGRLYSGQEAQAMGLVDRLVAHDELLPTALALAAEIAANPGPQLRWIKDLLTRNGSETDLAKVQQRELEHLQDARRSPEHKEAVSAFLEKRTPDFALAAK
jgi:enoyl-CoA hydratase/carnithine racemase